MDKRKKEVYEGLPETGLLAHLELSVIVWKSSSSSQEIHTEGWETVPTRKGLPNRRLAE